MEGQSLMMTIKEHSRGSCCWNYTIVIGIAALLLHILCTVSDSLNNAKMQKINETNSYFTGPLATDPKKPTLLAEIESGVTPEQVLAVDVMGKSNIFMENISKPTDH